MKMYDLSKFEDEVDANVEVYDQEWWFGCLKVSNGDIYFSVLSPAQSPVFSFAGSETRSH